MESDGETGVVGSGIGRVELSICKETEKPKKETIKGGYQVRAEMNEVFGCGFKSLPQILNIGPILPILDPPQKKFISFIALGLPHILV